MDEKDLVKTGMEVVLRPVTDIAENVLGVLGGDWLSEQRARNRAKLRKMTEEYLNKEGAKIDDAASPIVTPLLSSAQDESREELLNLWAKLLTAAMSPNRTQSYRREFVSVAKQLEPIDVKVLPYVAETGSIGRRNLAEMAQAAGASPDEVLLSYRNLAAVDLTEKHSQQLSMPFLSVLGREFKRQVFG